MRHTKRWLRKLPPYSRASGLYMTVATAAGLGIGLGYGALIIAADYGAYYLQALAFGGVVIGGIGSICRAIAHNNELKGWDHTGKLLALVAFMFAIGASVTPLPDGLKIWAVAIIVGMLGGTVAVGSMVERKRRKLTMPPPVPLIPAATLAALHKRIDQGSDIAVISKEEREGVTPR